MTLRPYREGTDGFRFNYEGFEAKLCVDGETGHATFRPMPPPLLDRYYQSDYISRSLEAMRGEFVPSVIDTARGILSYIGPLCGSPEIRTTHDIGCGSGRLVWAFQQLGMSASGNDASQEGVDTGNEFCGGTISAAPLDQALASLGRSVDLFTSFHVLEHLPDPTEAFRAVKRHLSPKGACYFTVPNGHSLQALVRGRRADPCLGFPTHLQYFTPLSLIDLLAEAGLDAVRVWTAPAPHLEGGNGFAQALGIPEELVVAPASWAAATVDNLLGYDLLVAAVHRQNTDVARVPGTRERAQQAFKAFTARWP